MNCMRYIITSCAFLSIMVSSAAALPFNDDMVKIKMRTGSMMKPKPEGSVPIGGAEQRFSTKQECLEMENPVARSKESVTRGKRLFSVNCLPCHGDISGENWGPGPVGQACAYKQPPNIASSDYHDRSDANIYGTIHFGAGLMGRVGWKLSDDETWDIVNYIKDLQSKN